MEEHFKTKAQIKQKLYCSVSVIIPSYKAENFVSKAIDSILAQEQVTTEVIVVEDGVFDKTRSVVEKYGSNVRHITLEKNHGACYARNVGLNEAKSDFVLFLDADDYIEGPLLKGLLDAIQKTKSSVSFGPWKVVDIKNNVSRRFIRPSYESPNQVVARWLSGRSGPPPCSILWRKSEILRIGGWNTNYTKNQDGELIIRAMLAQCTIAHSSEGAGVYWQHDNERISRQVHSGAFESPRMLYDYVSNFVKGQDTADLMVNNSLSYFAANVSALAYLNGLDDIANNWEKTWSRTTPRYQDLKFINGRIFIIHSLYHLFGIKYGTRAYKSIQSIKRRLASTYKSKKIAFKNLKGD